MNWLNLYGNIVEGNLFNIEVEIPVNCHATLYIPEEYSISNISIEKNTRIGQKLLKLGSGKYNFTAVKKG